MWFDRLINYWSVVADTYGNSIFQKALQER